MKIFTINAKYLVKHSKLMRSKRQIALKKTLTRKKLKIKNHSTFKTFIKTEIKKIMKLK